MRHNHNGIDEVLLENKTSLGDDYDVNPVDELLDGLHTETTEERSAERGEVCE